MQRKAISTLLAGAALAAAQCDIPSGTISQTITSPFRIQVQNISRPEVHNKYFNLFVAGGGDQHLFIGPVGNPTYDLTLVNGAINWVPGDVIACIGGEFSEIDHTTKLFMTGRGDPRAIFQPTYACNPDDTDETQIELNFLGWENQPPGGWICVRHAFDGSHEFRYYPPGNELIDEDRECIKVQLVIRPTDGPIPTGTTTTTAATTTTTATSTTTGTTTTTSSAPTSTATGEHFTDMTGSGWRFLGCAPEERRVVPADFPGRTLPHGLYAEDAMTNEKCLAHCGGLGYMYGGSEWSRECWCANSYASTRQPPTTLASLANCNYPCSGNSAQFCGGDAYLSLYEKCPTGGPCDNVVFT